MLQMSLKNVHAIQLDSSKVFQDILGGILVKSSAGIG